MRTFRFSLALLVLAACGGEPPAPSDEWATPGNPTGPELSEMVGSWKALDPSLVHPVQASALLEAARLLGSHPVLEIDAARAAALVGPDVASPGKKLFLVRALGAGRFTVYVRGADLFVHHPKPTKRQPLVVLLERAPSRVFVGR